MPGSGHIRSTLVSGALRNFVRYGTGTHTNVEPHTPSNERSETAALDTLVGNVVPFGILPKDLTRR
jgi:hypothetical protein